MTTPKTTRTLFRCPVCKADVERDVSDFPFCTPRCKVIDLGRWASDEYRIPGEKAYIPDPSSENEQY